MVDRIKIGNFLRKLRNEKGMTQEEIAEKFEVSSRSVSRWENGNTMPELGILVELSVFYEVDIKEIIDGERKSEIMEKERTELLTKVADYANEEKKMAVKKKSLLAYFSVGIAILVIVVFSGIQISENVKQQNNEVGIIGTWVYDGNEACTFNPNGIVSITDNFPISDTGLVEGVAVYYFTYPNVIRIIQQEDNNESSVEFEVNISDTEMVLFLMGEEIYFEMQNIEQ